MSRDCFKKLHKDNIIKAKLLEYNYVVMPLISLIALNDVQSLLTLPYISIVFVICAESK
jgi:hypothetical protein